MALLLRYANGGIILFEATGEMGVSLTDWNDFLAYNWHHHYDQIIYRKLYCERPATILTDLENFIKVVTKFYLLGNYWQEVQDQCKEVMLKEKDKEAC